LLRLIDRLYALDLPLVGGRERRGRCTGLILWGRQGREATAAGGRLQGSKRGGAGSREGLHPQYLIAVGVWEHIGSGRKVGRSPRVSTLRVGEDQPLHARHQARIRVNWRRHGIHIHLVGSGGLDDEPAAAGGDPGLSAGEERGTSGRCSPAVCHNEGDGSGGVCDGLHSRVPHRRPVAVARLRTQGIITAVRTAVSAPNWIRAGERLPPAASAVGELDHKRLGRAGQGATVEQRDDLITLLATLHPCEADSSTLLVCVSQDPGGHDLTVGGEHGLEVVLLDGVGQVGDVEVGRVLLGLPRHLCLVTLVLEFVDGVLGAAGGLEVHEAIPLASVRSFVQDSLSGTYRAELLTEQDKILVRGVRSESPDVEVGPGEEVPGPGGRGGHGVHDGRAGIPPPGSSRHHGLTHHSESMPPTPGPRGHRHNGC